MFLGTQECFLVIAQIPPQPSRTSSIHQWPLVTSVDGVGNDGSLEPSEQLLCPYHLPQSRHTTGAFGQPAAAQLCMVRTAVRPTTAVRKTVLPKRDVVASAHARANAVLEGNNNNNDNANANANANAKR